MGAFVGDKTSLFLRRRKGRRGQDGFVESTAPALAGAEIRFAASNGMIIACCVNAATSVQVSRNDGASWTARSVVALNAIGNSGTSGKNMVGTPHNAELFQSGNANNRSIRCSGIHTGVGGAMMTLPPDGFQNVFENSTVAGAPQECIDWDKNGEYYCTLGAKVAADAKGHGGRIGVASEAISFPATQGQQCVISLDDPAIPYPTFLSGDASAALDTSQFHKIWRVGAGNWQHKAYLHAGILGFAPRHFIQRDNLILAIDQTNARLMRSLDYGETWSHIDNRVGSGGVGSGPQRDLYRYGFTWYCLERDAPRVMRSRNNGTTWEANPVQLPSGTAQPGTTCDHNGKRLIFCNDGAANRVYTHRTTSEI